MAVLLANRSLGVRHRAAGAPDAHGEPQAASWAAMGGPWPGRAEEGPDVAEMGAAGGRTWVLAVDPAAWPLHQGDLVVEPSTGATWLVTTADLLTNNASPDIDYIRVEAHARTGASTRP